MSEEPKQERAKIENEQEGPELSDEQLGEASGSSPAYDKIHWTYTPLDKDPASSSEDLTLKDQTGDDGKNQSLDRADGWIRSKGSGQLVPSLDSDPSPYVVPVLGQHDVAYFGQDRIHDALDKDTPQRWPVEKKPCPPARV